MNTLPSSPAGTPADSAEITHGTVRVGFETRYLLQPALETAAAPLLVIATHGYGMNAEVMLKLVQLWYGARHWVASAEGPHGYFLGQRPGEGPEGYNWGVRSRRDTSIATHHEIIHGVVGAAGRASGIPRERTILVGFSQSVGMNYQFMARNPGVVAGAIGVCASPPRDWETNAEYQTVHQPVLHFSRSSDEYYTPEVLGALEGRLRTRLANLEYHMLEGAHRFPSKAASTVQAWEKRWF
jgi:predicted esterase